MRSRSIKIENVREIIKSAVFPSFSDSTWLFSLFLKRGFPLNMANYETPVLTEFS